jgi:hypothetical protein
MPIEKVLIEYAKVSLQLVQANDMIAELQAQLKAAKDASVPVAEK